MSFFYSTLGTHISGVNYYYSSLIEQSSIGQRILVTNDLANNKILLTAHTHNPFRLKMKFRDIWRLAYYYIKIVKMCGQRSDYTSGQVT